MRESSEAEPRPATPPQDDRALLHGVLLNLRPTRKMPRWSAVMQVVGCGSTTAQDLCRRFNLDPDEDIGGRRR